MVWSAYNRVRNWYCIYVISLCKYEETVSNYFYSEFVKTEPDYISIQNNEFVKTEPGDISIQNSDNSDDGVTAIVLFYSFYQQLPN